MNGMKKTSKQIRDFISKFKKRNTGELSDPVYYWVLGLIFAFVIFLVGVVFIISDFRAQFNSSDSENSTSEKPILYAEKEIKEYAELYRKKEEVFNELRKNKQVIEQIVAPVVEEAPLEEATSTTPLAEVPIAQ